MEEQKKELLNFKDYLTIREAAIFIGVAPNTLRNWERQKRIKTYGAPLNKRRLYKKSDLEDYLSKIEER